MLQLTNVNGRIDLQATLSASSAGIGEVVPHHPITCPSTLALFEDGSLACEHTRTAPDNHRTRACIDHSVAILLIECAVQAFD